MRLRWLGIVAGAGKGDHIYQTFIAQSFEKAFTWKASKEMG
jgi:hypothetical protein